MGKKKAKSKARNAYARVARMRSGGGVHKNKRKRSTRKVVEREMREPLEEERDPRRFWEDIT